MREQPEERFVDQSLILELAPELFFYFFAVAFARIELHALDWIRSETFFLKENQSNHGSRLREPDLDKIGITVGARCAELDTLALDRLFQLVDVPYRLGELLGVAVFDCATHLLFENC